jgi:hypothetical protein
MVNALANVHATDGATVAAEQIPIALTAEMLVFQDGATQAFELDGTTVYAERGRRTPGEWYVDDDGHFCSFWPPSYRAAYDLQWIVTDGRIQGLRFTERGRGSRFDGLYA